MATYKQPRRLNFVSVTLVLVLAAAGYAGVSTWPVLSLNADVKNALADALPRIYRANLLPEPDSTVATEEVKQALITQLGALGVGQPEAALAIHRDTRTVLIEAHLATAIDLKLLGKKIPVTLNPRVETSAERVQY